MEKISIDNSIEDFIGLKYNMNPMTMPFKKIKEERTTNPQIETLSRLDFFLVLFFGRGGTHNDAQGLLISLYSDFTPGRLGVVYRVAEFELG